jgi:hypothetical protein
MSAGRVQALLAVAAGCCALAALQTGKIAPATREIFAQASTISVRWVQDSSDASHASVEVSGLTGTTLRELERSNWKLAEWQRLLSVYAEQGDVGADLSLPPMLGSYLLRDGLLVFKPEFALERGLRYRAILNPLRLPGDQPSGSKVVAAILELPALPSNPSTVVSQVYPTAGTLPENLLKFYVQFSAPMSRGRIYDHIHLRDEAGKSVELPFLEIDEELWDPTMSRLTLFIDPGRIKRGVRPLEEVGPALEAGKQYSLIIDAAWKDGAGIPLKESFQKRFRVGPPDREPPDPARWKLQLPHAGTRQPLVVTFPEPMDHALARRLIRVATGAGRAVEGETVLEEHECRWLFSPSSPWRGGLHSLVIQTTLEDLAGNNIGKPFEVDLFEGIQRKLTSLAVKVPFQIH